MNVAPKESLRERLTRFSNERRAIAKTNLRPPPREFTAREQIIRGRATIADELAAIDSHLVTCEKLKGSLSTGQSYKLAEITVELRGMHILRQEIAMDMPIITYPDSHHAAGCPLSARDRLYRRYRAKELRRMHWENAERATAEGDHRRAYHLRYDALRARQLCENELMWRPRLSGY